MKIYFENVIKWKNYIISFTFFLYETLIIFNFIFFYIIFHHPHVSLSFILTYNKE
jgi:hypothetical protein